MIVADRQAGLPQTAATIEADATGAQWARLLAPGVSIGAIGVLGVTATALGLSVTVGGEGRDLGLFLIGALLLPPICAALYLWLVRPDERRGTLVVSAAIAVLLILTGLPILLFLLGGNHIYWREQIAIVRAAIRTSMWLWAAAAVLIVALAGLGAARRRLSMPRVLASRAWQVTLFVLALFAANIALFWVDFANPYMTLFVRLFFDPPFYDSPAPFGLARALPIALLGMAAVVGLRRLETSLVRRRSPRLPLVRAAGLCVAMAVSVVFFFDFSLSNDTFHYMTNVAPALHVLHGGTPMVDVFSQYGPGPVLATTAGFLVGPATFGTAQITAQVANLTFYAIWLVCLYRMTSWKLPALLLGFFSIALYFATWSRGYGNVNEAPSILGLRHLPPLLMVLALSCLRWPRRHSAFTALSTFFAGLWSVETLIGTLGIHFAFLGLLALRDRAVRRLVIDAVKALLPVAAALAVMTLGTMARAGAPPDFGTYLAYLAWYNMLEGSWAIVASVRFYGWVPLLLAILLVSSDAWARVFQPNTRVFGIDDEALFHRFLPMAMLLLLQLAYFVARSVDYTLVMALLPFCAIAIAAALGFAQVVAAGPRPVRLLAVIPLALGFWALAYTGLSLLRPHYLLFDLACDNPARCETGPYSLLVHECRDHGRCSPSALLQGLSTRVHERSALERVGASRSDIWIPTSSVAMDALSMIQAYAPDAPSVTVLLGHVVYVGRSMTGDDSSPLKGDNMAGDIVMMYSGKWHRWPRSFTWSDELVPGLAQRIIDAPVRLREGELVLVRRDDVPLGGIEGGILERIRAENTVCRLPHPSTEVIAYRVAGPSGCPPGSVPSELRRNAIDNGP